MTDARTTADPLGADPFGAAPAGNGWGWLMAYGVLSVLLGFFAFVAPFAATFAATLVIGAFFIAAGVVSLGVGLFGKGVDSRGYAIAFAILSLIVGLVMAFEPATGALSLTVLVAIWLAVRGGLEIVLGLRLRHGRGWMIALGIVNLLLAAFVLATLPWSAATLPGYILGISFVFGGIASLRSAVHHRKGAAAFAIA